MRCSSHACSHTPGHTSSHIRGHLLRGLLIASCVIAVLAVLSIPTSAQDSASQAPAVKLAPAVRKTIDGELSALQDLYFELHRHPELALHEVQTSRRMASELKKLGFEVSTGIGGHGVVGILKNGAGPTVMVRADMDGLPITEKTSLPYASKVRTRDKEGNDVGTMHACGHDMHMTCWVGTARTLVALKNRWQGTLMFIAQPAEEIGAGARMMLDDGLFKRFPRPDYCFGLHCDSRMPHGHVAYSDGLLLANVDTVDITVKGKGGHGAAPHTTIDPVVIAARIIIDLQTIVSREINPLDAAVVTVGSIHGGTKHNIIPSEVKLQLTVRTLKDNVRAHVLKSIERIAKAAAMAGRAPDPVVKIALDNYTPALFNDARLARQTASIFKDILGEPAVHEVQPVLGGEDFGRYGRAGVPIFFYFLGTQPPERVMKAMKGGDPLPSLHSDLYFPIPEPTIRTGVLTMTSAVLNQLAK